MAAPKVKLVFMVAVLCMFVVAPRAAVIPPECPDKLLAALYQAVADLENLFPPVVQKLQVLNTVEDRVNAVDEVLRLSATLLQRIQQNLRSTEMRTIRKQVINENPSLLRTCTKPLSDSIQALQKGVAGLLAGLTRDVIGGLLRGRNGLLGGRH